MAEEAPKPATTPKDPTSTGENKQLSAASEQPSPATGATKTPSTTAVSKDGSGASTSASAGPTSSDQLKRIETPRLSASANIPLPQDI